MDIKRDNAGPWWMQFPSCVIGKEEVAAAIQKQLPWPYVFETVYNGKSANLENTGLRITFKSPEGSKLILYMKPRLRPDLKEHNNLFFSHGIGDISKAINTLIAAKFKINARVRIGSSQSNIGDDSKYSTRITTRERTRINASNGDARIELDYKAYHGWNATRRIEWRFNVKARSKTTKKYAIAVKKTDGDASAAIEAASHSVLNAVIPSPCNTAAPETWAGQKGGLNHLTRNACVRSAAIIGIGSLKDDLSFSLDVVSPKVGNLWFCMRVELTQDTTTRGLTRFLSIAFNGKEWHQLHGEKNLRISLKNRSDAKFTESDLEFLRETCRLVSEET